MKLAVYAGSFDPVTLGHEDIIARAAATFDRLLVVVGQNSTKTPMLSKQVRLNLLKESCQRFSNVNVDQFQGLLVKYCENVGAGFIVRGLRAVTDFEYELLLAHANKTQSPVETIFFPTKPELSFVSSSTVRELARHDGSLIAYVSSHVERAIQDHLDKIIVEA